MAVAVASVMAKKQKITAPGERWQVPEGRADVVTGAAELEERVRADLDDTI